MWQRHSITIIYIQALMRKLRIICYNYSQIIAHREFKVKC